MTSDAPCCGFSIDLPAISAKAVGGNSRGERYGRNRARYVHPNGYTEPVRIRRAAWVYQCNDCGQTIERGELHAVAYIAFAWHFCLDCVVGDE